MHPHIASLLSHPKVRAAIERALASQGRGGDTNIVHVNPGEMARLKAWGGSGTINPHTGLPEFYAGGPGSDGHGGSVGGADQGGMGAHPGSDGPRGSSGGVGGPRGGSDGSGAGAGGGHAGEGGFVNNPRPPVVTPPPPPVIQPPPGIAIAAAPPVTLAPQLSSTATKDLTGGRFGAVPAWDLKPYNIGDAPTSYPVPGIDQPPAVKPPPPTLPPPPTGGGTGGGGITDPGHPFGGTGDGSRNPWNNGGGTGQPTQSGPADIANFMNVLHANGIATGAHPITHQTPGFEMTVDGGGANSGGQMTGLAKMLGVTPKPQAPTALPPQNPAGKQPTAAKFFGQAPTLGGPPAKPTPAANPGPLLGQTTKKTAKKATARSR